MSWRRMLSVSNAVILQRLSRGISGKRAVTLLSIIVAIHLGLMFYYIKSNFASRQAAKRDAVIQKIINAIFLVEATPLNNRAHAVAAMADPDVLVSLTKTPTWDLRFKQVSFWSISKALRNHFDSFALSIEMGKDQWLNIKATIYTHILLDQLLLIAVEVLVLGSILISAWSINRFTKPLRRFKQAAEHLGIDLHSAPMDVIRGPTVVREAAEAMNKMQTRIQDLIRDRTQMLAAISHDLRTPITRMKLRAQFIADDKLQDTLSSDLDEMEKMVSETLAFAREDSAAEASTPVDLISLLDTICEDLQDMGKTVRYHTVLHRAVVSGRLLALKRAFTNLINNGLRYGHVVDVTIVRRHKNIMVLIEDDGPGIPPEERERVFAPFYRGERSRSRDTGGVGLGLAVTRDIFNAHNAKIILRNRKPHGLKVVVLFP